MDIKKTLNYFIFVRKCACCGRILSKDEGNSAFCDKCLLAWRYEMTRSCQVCLKSAVECTCMPKLLSESGALVLRRLSFYEADKAWKPNNRLVLFLKDKKNKRVSRFVAKELLPMVMFEASVLGFEDPSEEMVILYVPRSRKSKALQGHDQSMLVCRELSEQSGIPWVPLIRRRWGGKEQKKLTSRERAKNISELLWIDEEYVSEVRGKCVVLFDDICTTGASFAAAVKLLKGIGADKVLCFSVCSSLLKKKDVKAPTNDCLEAK